MARPKNPVPALPYTHTRNDDGEQTWKVTVDVGREVSYRLRRDYKGRLRLEVTCDNYRSRSPLYINGTLVVNQYTLEVSDVSEQGSIRVETMNGYYAADSTTVEVIKRLVAAAREVLPKDVLREVALSDIEVLREFHGERESRYKADMTVKRIRVESALAAALAEQEAVKAALTAMADNDIAYGQVKALVGQVNAKVHNLVSANTTQVTDWDALHYEEHRKTHLLAQCLLTMHAEEDPKVAEVMATLLRDGWDESVEALKETASLLA